MTTYAAPAPQKPIYSTPVTPRPPVYSPPANPPHHSTFNYMGHQAHRVPAPPTTTPTPAKVPFTYPSTTPKPYNAYSAPSAPVTGPSLLDLPWVVSNIFTPWACHFSYNNIYFTLETVVCPISFSPCN
jgi:hypothetical protein